MRNRVAWLSLVLAAAAVVFVAAGPSVRSAEALPGDICQLTIWDSTGNVVSDGEVVQGNGEFYVLARVEDDGLGFVRDFFEEGPGAEVVQETIDLLLGEIEDLEEEIALLDPEDDAEEIAALEAEIFAREEVVRELEEALEGFFDYNIVTVDSQTGSARIRSYAEVGGFELVKPRVYHRLIEAPGVLTQKVDHMFPNWFADPDGHDLDSISAWLEEVAGIPLPSGISKAALDADNVCGNPDDVDGWKFADLRCIEAGSLNVTVTPNQVNSSTENTVMTQALVCPSQVDTAEIKSTHNTLETQPVGTSASSATITVTTYDQFGNNVDGGEVTFITNNCKFTNPLAGAAGDFGHQPAAGGPVLTMWSDTDSQADANFLDNNPLQTYAGTAEVTLDCTLGTPGLVTVTAQVQREGADIVLEYEITLIGPTAANGLSLTLTPDSLECGETLQAEAMAVDANGQPVSNGTVVYFTTDTSSGIINGKEGGQGSNTTIDGKTVATIAMSPDDPGIHTVIAYTIDKNGALLAQVSDTFECSVAAAPAAPAVVPPVTGTGTITPPNTGDAGLVGNDGATTSAIWLGVAGMVTALLLVPAMFKTCYARYLDLHGRRR
jgi:hypothetical protein